MSTDLTFDVTTNGVQVMKSFDNGKPPKSWRTWLIGRPLSTADAPHQTIGKVVGLAVFASDALSSTAYATQEILVVLAAAGTVAFGYAFPIALAIVALLAIITISYEQTIHTYPNGGGAYIVARDNLGTFAALVAAAALLTDYILTVAVSISSAVAQLASAYPDLSQHRVILGVGMVLVMMVINLRGVKEAGVTFSIPTYFFLAMMFLTLSVGFVRYFTGAISISVAPPSDDVVLPGTAVTLFLLLHAFSNGTTALTGVEAISNGVPAFKEPRSRNAGTVLIGMAIILGTLLLGITFLAVQIGAVPVETETVISQLARAIYGSRSLLYLLLMGATTVILVMAANTAFADFPRLSALTAQDGFLPRQLTFRGSRLVYSRGIALLAIVASMLIIVFQASVTALIPLYAIGVFLSFTLSQLGMARRWWKSGQLKHGEELREAGSIIQHDRRWALKMGMNTFGAVCTAGVVLVFAVTKFRDGAWIVILLTPLLVAGFHRIHGHYQNLAESLTLDDYKTAPTLRRRHRVVLPVSGVHRGTLKALQYARSLSPDVTAVHVSLDPEESKRVEEKWERWGEQTRLVIIESPFRLLFEPLLGYIDYLASLRQPGEMLTVVVPQFIPKSIWANALHSQTALWLRNALLGHRGIVVIEVPYQVD